MTSVSESAVDPGLQALPALPAPRAAALDAIGPQWLPVTGFIPQRFLVTYRAPAAQAAALVPAPLQLDTRGGFALLSVCVLRIEGMGIAGTPRWLRFDNAECLYRLAVRLDGEPTFLTLRSDVSAAALALLGRRFSHYRPRRAEVAAERRGGRLRLSCRSGDGLADAAFHADGSAGFQVEPGSLFGSAQEAGEFLVGMRFSVGVRPGGRVQVQDIEHSPWQPRFVRPEEARFDFLSRTGARWSYDSTLYMEQITQTWRRTRCR